MKRIIDVDENLVCEGFVRNFTEEEKEVLINAIRYSIPYEPKGEWIIIHNALGETKYQCNQCQHYIKPSDDKNFCPNCGVKMQKEVYLCLEK